jgi:hypothetical protein
MSEGSPVDAAWRGTLRDWAVLIGSDRDREVKVMWAHAGRDRMMGCLFALFVGCSPRLRTAPSWVK